MIHNIVVVDGQEYKAVKEVGTAESCDGCVAHFDENLCGSIYPCGAAVRDDGEPVIYKPHYKLKHK